MKIPTPEEICGDCGVSPGELHQDGCDVEQCPNCGGQYLSCGCDDQPDSERIKWDGEWPGKAECREYGFWCKFIPGFGWYETTSTDKDATEDLNRLYQDCRWDKAAKRWVKK